MTVQMRGETAGMNREPPAATPRLDNDYNPTTPPTTGPCQIPRATHGQRRYNRTFPRTAPREARPALNHARPAPLPRLASLLLLLILAASLCARDTLADVRRRGELRWAGDEEGGAPYIFRAEDGSSRLIGFEIDLMDYLGGRLPARPVFKQAAWKNLLNELQIKSVDVAVNGIELTSARLRGAIATVPYFVYELHLLGRADETRIAGWDDLRRPRPGGGRWSVGVLEGTSADHVLTEKFADHVEVRRYEGTTEAFRDVENHNIDFTVTDTPAAVVYGAKFKVKQFGVPIERGYYVIYLRPGDEALRDELNKWLKSAIADGTLQTILGRYKLWNATQESLGRPDVQLLPETMRPEGADEGGWAAVRRYWPLLIRAAGMTVLLSVVSMPIAVFLGLLVALGRMYGPALLRWPLTLYVEVVRGTPLLLQLLFIYFGLLPAIFNVMPLASQEWLRPFAALVASVAGLSLNYAAYEAEIYRAGLLAIPAGQMEAALALGLTRRQAVRHVIVPQALRLVIPPVTNDFINLFKDTAVCSVITVVDLSKMYNIAVNNVPSAFLELALVTAGLYLVMSYPLSLVTRRLETPATKAHH